jgi:ribosomal-protein-alanine N-acetyltransferase
VPFILRDFHPEDFETLWRIDQECFPPGIAYSKAELKLYIRRRGAFTLVAAGTDKTYANKADLNKAGANKSGVAGFIVVHAGAVGHVITIDVVATARRDGVGSLLLGAAEVHLREGGSKAVGLEAAVDNRAALLFYKRHGYEVVKTIPRYYSNGMDALVLRKELEAAG